MTYQPDPYAATALGDGWMHARRVAAGLAQLFRAARAGKNGRPALMRGVRREAMAQLRRAEAMVRRMLIIIAASLPRPKIYPYTDDKSAPLKGGAAHGSDYAQTRPPLTQFRLAEPEQAAVRALRAGRLADYAPPALTFSEPDRAPADPSDLLPAANLFARIDALSDALSHPARHAARMARWIARRQISAQGLARKHPLRLGGPPGWSKHGQRRDAEIIALGDLDAFAREAFEAWDTS